LEIVVMRERIDELPTISDWGDVPEFANEAEEAEFWGTHGLGGAALASLGTFEDDALPRPRRRKRRFWQRISVPLAVTVNPVKVPAVENKYVHLGRAYRGYAA
jgi:hypothetical protein